MKKALKVLRNIILAFLLLIILTILTITIIRKYNDNKYRPEDYDQDQVMMDPKDLSQYDTDIPGVEVTRIEDGYVNGFRLKPEEKTRPGVVITFGGSEGSPNYSTATMIAEEGYEVLALYFFGMEGQQEELVQVPLEFFEEVLAYIDGNIEDNGIITVYGASKGAELILNLAGLYPEIDNIILMTPAAWNYMGLSYEYSQEFKSSWTYKGEELPIIDMTKGDPNVGLNLFLDFFLNRPIDYRPGYETATNNDPNKEEARIRFEDSDANILIFAGDDDHMWQGEVAGEKIKDTRPENTDLYI